MGACQDAIDFTVGVVTLDPDKIESSVKGIFRDLVAPILEPVFSVLGIRDQTIHSVETATIKLLEGTTHYQNSILLSTIVDGGDITEGLKYALSTSPKVTIRKYSNNALQNYSDGVPTLKALSNGIDEFAVTEYLGSLGNFTSGINITLIDLGIPDPTLWVQDYLWQTYGFNVYTSEIIINGDVWFYNSFIHDTNTNTYKVNISRITTDFEIQELPDVIPGFDDETYYVAIYEQLNNIGYGEFWFYKLSDKTIPTLDPTKVNVDITGSFELVPIVAIRENYISVNTDKTSSRYKETLAVLEPLKIVDLNQIITQLEDNPQASSIQDAFIIFGANLYNKDDAHLNYFFNIFKRFSEVPGYTKTDFLNLTPRARSGTSFTYTIEEGNFRSTLSYNYLDLSLNVTGSIGNIGKVTLDFFILTDTPPAPEVCVEDPDHPAQEICEPPHKDSTRGLVNSYIRLRKQISNNTYEEMTVHGLTLANLIKIDGSNIRVKLIPLVDPDDPNKQKDREDFILPLSFEFINTLSGKYADEVVYQSLHVVIYAHEVTELEYYQTNKFIWFIGSLLEIATIILTIVLVLSGTGELGLTLGEQLLIVIGNILIQASITLVLREILSHNLSDVEKFLAAVAYIYVSKEATTVFNKDLVLHFSDKLLLYVNSILTVFQLDLDNKTQALIQEQEEFETLSSSKLEELEQSQDYLKIDGSIDVTLLLNSKVVPILDTWSTPTEFYNRTLTINVADIVLNQSRTYVQSALNLDNLQTNFDRNINDFKLLPELT